MTLETRSIQQLTRIITSETRLAVLTGAGCSTASGLGDYRDLQGNWKRPQPITAQTFLNNTNSRNRYWARSSVGWPAFQQAQPSSAHHALASLEVKGIVTAVITQNVDELHQKAGHQHVIDLHGVLSTVSCINCGFKIERDEFQSSLFSANPWLSTLDASYAPDGDADLETDAALTEKINAMHIPGCAQCQSLLKPDVVFFGENVPKERVENAMQQVQDADALLVAGSSLKVFSGFRFCRAAADRGQSIIIVNNGVTRADDLATLKIGGDCGEQLSQIDALLTK